ncbi:phospholipase D family protein [Pseudooceanicola algae]|uniref:Phospholipase D n=1 Tax=Pseudooceanicola algae TaxID=1537215 RepID=A0A418SGT9_9RHOB|nr:phospholipase D family protein [Pseudooceanicola algae]QPM88865.1 Cardiolipin synthase B [Pseudooceanicola algae]
MPSDRTHHARTEPLVTAAEMFPALERLCLNAREELLMSFRILDPLTRLRSDEAAELELSNWAELIAHVASRGVKVRLLIADFDPLFTAELHQDAWRCARQFAQRQPAGTEILCAPHEAASAPVWKRVFANKIHERIEALKRYAPEQLTPLQQRALKGEITLRPATMHQKFAIADGRTAVIGGIDVNERRWDDEDHSRRPEETWHDVSIKVSGLAVPDLRRHFAECWDRSIAADAVSFGAEPSPVAETRALDKQRRIATGPRLLRTQSHAAKGRWRIGPVPEVTEHEDAHIAAFESAGRLIYIETQFFRHLPLARSLASMAASAPRLQVILVLPTEPERVIFDGHDGMDVRHAQALQLSCLTVLRRAFGDRLAVVAPAQPRRAPEHTPMPLHSAGIVYLHSKVTLVDDHIGIVGSANLNGRSMRWDTEASLQFHGERDVQAMRQKLMSNWLRGREKGMDPTRAADWTRIAEEEAARDPEDREAYILPWPEARNRRFARPVPILPAEMF